MSRPSFRPRPIDHAKPLPIIKSSKDLRNEDDVVVNRALPAIATGVDPAEEEERHLQQALLASVYGENSSAAAADIPIPVITAVEAPAYPELGGPFKRPETYIAFNRSDEELERLTIDYDADFEDEEFVKKYCIEHPTSEKSKTAPLTVGKLEKGMDALEKEQGRLENEDKVIVPYSAVRNVLALVLKDVSELCRSRVYAHWFDRRDRHPEPFLRFYQKQPDPTDTNPAVAFRPRDRDLGAAAGRRLNTYENFRRATTLRAELDKLRKILRACISRDRVKAELLSVAALQARLQLVAQGGARVEVASQRSLHASRGSVVLAGTPPITAAALPAADLKLPITVPIVPLHEEALSVIAAAAAVVERVPKKIIRRTISRQSAERVRDSIGAAAAETRPGTRPVGQVAGIDNYGFDEHGNRFLKHMRYFAGGFMNYGVSPYDHRVFAAASERNTVRELPREPQSITLPHPNVPFARLPDTEPDREEVARKAFLRARARAKVGPKENKSGGISSVFPPDKSSAITKRRRPIRVRGRVGRGGRIIFDRVTYERERGVKAASYPSSVEMGGVYTGGLPLEAVPRVLRSGVRRGALGNVALLQPRPHRDEDDEDANSSESDDMYSTLVAPLKPMVQLSRGIVKSNGEVDYWPHRRKRTGAKLGRTDESHSMIRASSPPNDTEDEMEVDSGMRLRSWNKSNAAYSAVGNLISEVVSDASTP